MSGSASAAVQEALSAALEAAAICEAPNPTLFVARWLRARAQQQDPVYLERYLDRHRTGLEHVLSAAVNEAIYAPEPLLSLAERLESASMCGAEDAAKHAAKQVSDSAKQGAFQGDGLWRWSSWLQSLTDLHDGLARVLLAPLNSRAPEDAPRAELEYARGLARVGSREAVLALLVQHGALETLAEQIWCGLQNLAAARAATGLELHDKFVADPSSCVMTFGGLDTYFAGLEGLVGPPSANILSAMSQEHCCGPDAKAVFETKNYEIETTSEVEWWFVHDPAAGLRRLGLAGYPAEKRAGAAKLREARPPAEFDHERRGINDKLKRQKCAPLCLEEFLGARLYTGPMYLKYNGLLRSLSGDARLVEAVDRMTLGNKYCTTLHAINSAVVKMGKVLKATRVYRGLLGSVLPESFLAANSWGVRGGVEYAFMSTTTDLDVARQYAGFEAAGEPKASIVLSIQMGMIDRGADLSWLSQYPHEREIVFAPLTGVEVQSMRVDGEVLSVDMRLSINLTSRTIEQVIGKMQQSHLDLIQLLLDDLRYAGAPLGVLGRMESLQARRANQEPTWFNDASNLNDATKHALAVMGEIFGELASAATWADEWLKHPPAVVSARIRAVAELCARTGGHDAAIQCLRFLIEHMHTASKRTATAPTPRTPRTSTSAPTPRASMSGAPAAEPALAALKRMPSSGRFLEAVDAVEARVQLEAAMRHCDASCAEEAWRLEIAQALLAEGAPLPWPKVLTRLLRDAPSSGLLLPFCTLVRPLVTEVESSFGVGDEVLALIGGVWRSGQVVRVVRSGVRGYDVLSGGSRSTLRRSMVVKPGTGGAGALLREAASTGFERLVSQLLADGVCPFHSDGAANTALHAAATHGHARVCKLLVQAGADDSTPNAEGLSAFELAFRNGQNNVRRTLHPGAADKDVPTPDELAKLPELFRVSAAGDVEGVRRAITAHGLGGAVCHLTTGSDGRVRLALSWGRTHKRVTPLMLGCRAGQLGVVRTLMRARADVEAQSKEGASAVMISAEEGYEELLSSLLDAGAYVDVRHPKKQKTPLWYACSNGMTSVVPILLAHGACVDHADELGITPMIRAARNGHAEAIAACLAGGAQPETADKKGNTCLMVAARLAHSAVVRQLLDAKADVGTRRPSGATALLDAAESGDEPTVQLLLDAGADVGTVDAVGTSALTIACRGGFDIVSIALIHAGAPVDHRTHDGVSALMAASRAGHAQVVRMLLQNYADPNAADGEGATPLIHACLGEGSTEVVAQLLAAGAQTDVADAGGRTAHDCAVQCGHQALWPLLGQPSASPSR